MTDERPETEDAPKKPRRSILVTGFRLLTAGVLLLASTVWVFAVDLSGSPLAWPSHLLASVAPQVSLLLGPLALWWIVRRRFAAGFVTLVACGAGLASLVPGIVGGRGMTAASDGAGDSVRVTLVVANCLASNEDREALRNTLLGTDADVIALLEAPEWLIDEMREQQKAGAGPWRDRYPHYFIPDRARGGFKLLLTKDAARSFETGSTNPNALRGPGWRGGVVEIRGASFGVAMVHPQSPRSPARHSQAESSVDAAIEGLSAAPSDRPLFVLGDFNSSPTGVNSRRLCGSLGLVRAKPWDDPSGTFPAWAPWPMQIAIDGVLVRPDTNVDLWRTFEIPGSDHLGVSVTVRAPVSASAPE